MSRRDTSHQCWVCYKKYPAEQLGRVLLDEFVSRKGLPVHRVVCTTCYYAICIYMIGEGDRQPPAYHGF